MAGCYLHKNSLEPSKLNMGGFNLMEMLRCLYGTSDEPPCLRCGVILEAMLCCEPGLVEDYSGIPWDSIMIQITKFNQLERVSVFNVTPLVTSERTRKLVSFDVIERPPSIAPCAMDIAKSPEVDDFLVETMWAGMSETWDVLEDSRTKAAFDRAAGWLAYCMKHDEPCNPPDKTFVPHRLLYVGSNDGVEPVLIEPTEPTAYACLSYCWGNDVEDVLRTTTSNLNDHYKEVSFSSMPGSVQDAVRVCRGLGIMHLWVDSICIVQDDYDAWYQDACMMDQIYLNAQVTISALEPSGCKTGFLGKQKYGLPGWQRTIKLPGGLEEFIVRPGVDQTGGFSLDKRGWCLQETLLSRRRLCFDGNEMSWECLCRKVCECGHYVWSKFGSLEKRDEFNGAQFGGLLQGIASESTSAQKIRAYNLGVSERRRDWLTGTRGTHHVEGGPGRIYDLWRNVASNYSRRTVSRRSDKLVALTGLANIMRKADKDKINAENGYLAGLWKMELHFDLVWRVAAFKPRPILSPYEESDVVKQEHRFPSWSWASCYGVISYDDYISPWLDWAGGFPLGLSVIDKCLVKGVEGIAEDGTPSVEGGRLSLEGALLPVELVVLGEYIHPNFFTPSREADVYPFHLGIPRNDMPDISAFVRPRTLYSARVYLDEHADSTISKDEPHASCWTEGRCQENCCSWNKGQDETRYYCFRLFSWVLNSDTSAQPKGGSGGETTQIETCFLALKLSHRIKGAFERIGVGAWAWRQDSNWDIEDSNPFRTARMEVIDII